MENRSFGGQAHMLTMRRDGTLAGLMLATLAFSLSARDASSQEASLSSTIDRLVEARLADHKLSAAPLCDDSTFLRRVYLDLCGTIPTADEAREFLQDSAADKRRRLIDRLLADPRFARHQSEVWDQVYFGRNPPGYSTDKRAGFQKWLRECFEQNTPYDEIASALLRAEGNSAEQGAPMFLVQYRNQPEDATEKITQTFLGVQLQCARCHDHPFESWSQLDFYGMAAFVARLQVVDMGNREGEKAFAIGEKNLGEINFTGPAAEDEPGKKGVPVSPKFLLGSELDEPELPEDFEEPRNFPNNKPPPAPKFSRKNALADWITSPENPYFARALANRVWAQLLGRGLVHPIDNLSESNPPTHPELLDELTRQLVEHQFDLRWYIREVVNSQTYQRGATGDVADELPQWFERARVRPLTAEELVDAWRVATGYDATDSKLADQLAKGNRFYPLTTGYHLAAFGEPSDGTGNFLGGLHEQLYMTNGGIDRLLTQQQDGLLHALAEAGKDEPLESRIETLFLAALSRYPSSEEREHFVQFFAEGNERDLWRDALWALLTCSEFRFNH